MFCMLACHGHAKFLSETGCKLKVWEALGGPFHAHTTQRDSVRARGQS